MYWQQAEAIVSNANPDKEYLPITGLPEFTKRAALLAYGSDSGPLTQGAVCTISVCFSTDIMSAVRLR